LQWSKTKENGNTHWVAALQATSAAAAAAVQAAGAMQYSTSLCEVHQLHQQWLVTGLRLCYQQMDSSS